MIDKIISHYKILEKLGQGGMGVVYKAEDTKLKRTVALKFLPPEFSRDTESKERFIHEAQAASALEHNNICNIHEIDETKPAPGESGDGRMFIVMAYYQGETLKEKIEKGPLKLEQALDIAIKVSQGLSRAHEANITHRDIKPANIIITERGEVKIVDFGLAKLAGRTKLTKSGTTVGTVAYMSPEQARGEDVDSRTDIWSLGVVLYEMVTGQQPFRGDYEQAVIYSIVNEEPEPLTGLRTGVPMELERITKKALAKSLAERYQHTEDMFVDLSCFKKQLLSQRSKKQVQLKTTSLKSKLLIFGSVAAFIAILILSGIFFLPKKNINVAANELPVLAVFPFSNLSDKPEEHYIGSALAAEIIGDLNYIQSISVRPFSSVREYENQGIDALTALNDLKVDFMVAGNYYVKEGKKMRLNVELINAHKNVKIWGEPIEVEYKDWHRLQDIVSEKVMNGLKLKFSQRERSYVQANVSQNPLAYDYYLRSITYPLSIEGCQLAIEMLKKSIQLDSTYAPSFVELGYRTKYIGESVVGASIKYKEAEQFYLKAFSLNNELIGALVHLAGKYTEIGNTEKAIEMARQAVGINPQNAFTHYRLSYVYRYSGMLKESEQEVKKALQLDPNNSQFQSVALTYMYLGEYKKALETFDYFKESPWVSFYKGEICIRLGQLDEATDWFNHVLKIEPDEIFGINASASLAFINNNKEEGLQIIKQLEENFLNDSELLNLLAEFYGRFGDNKNCIRVLRKAVETGFFNYPFMLIDSFLDPVRENPEFQDVLNFAKAKRKAFKKKYFNE